MKERVRSKIIIIMIHYHIMNYIMIQIRNQKICEFIAKLIVKRNIQIREKDVILIVTYFRI